MRCNARTDGCEVSREETTVRSFFFLLCACAVPSHKVRMVGVNLLLLLDAAVSVLQCVPLASGLEDYCFFLRVMCIVVVLSRVG